MPLFYIVHLIVRIFSDKTEDFGSFKLFDNIIQIIIILGSSSKLLQYIKYREEFSFFEQMFIQVIKELIPFFMAFIMFIFIFGICLVLMQVDVDRQEDYTGINLFLRLILQTLRISCGDIHIYDYSNWTSYNPNPFDSTQTIAFFLIWIIWMTNVFLMLVIMLNLLIAQVG